jgi:hypothetical protein
VLNLFGATQCHAEGLRRRMPCFGGAPTAGIEWHLAWHQQARNCGAAEAEAEAL